MSDEILKEYYSKELYKLTPEDRKDEEFLRKHGLLQEEKPKEDDLKASDYKEYIKRELNNSENKEEVKEKIKQDYEKGELSEEFYISILKEFFGEREAFLERLSITKDKILEDKKKNSEQESIDKEQHQLEEDYK